MQPHTKHATVSKICLQNKHLLYLVIWPFFRTFTEKVRSPVTSSFHTEHNCMSMYRYVLCVDENPGGHGPVHGLTFYQWFVRHNSVTLIKKEIKYLYCVLIYFLGLNCPDI